MTLWAGNFIVVKGAVAVVPPVTFTFTRFGLAALTLLVVLRWREGGIRLPHPDALRIGLLGVLGFGVYQVLWTIGLEYIPAGDSALLIATAPVLTAVLAAGSGADTWSPTKFGGVLLSFVGVALVIAGGTGIELTGSLVGSVLTLGAAACWAVYTAFGAPILRRHSPLVTTTWAIVAGTAFMAPLGIGQYLVEGPAQISDPAAILLAVGYSGIIAAGIANVVVFNAIRLLGPTRITALQSLVPAIAVILAFLILDEPIRAGQVIGGAIIIAGVALTRWGPRWVEALRG